MQPVVKSPAPVLANYTNLQILNFHKEATTNSVEHRPTLYYCCRLVLSDWKVYSLAIARPSPPQVYEERRQESLKIMDELNNKFEKIQEVISFIEVRNAALRACFLVGRRHTAVCGTAVCGRLRRSSLTVGYRGAKPSPLCRRMFFSLTRRKLCY